MKVIVISGKAGHGKDTIARMMNIYLRSNHKKVLIIHYGDLLKYICKSMFNWNGKKDEKGRTLLQHIGTECVRTKKPDFWVNYIADLLYIFDGEWDYVLIPDTRFPNEIEGLRREVMHIRVHRPNFNMLTKEQQNHPSETALDNYKADYVIENDGTLENLAQKIKTFVEEELHERKESNT